MVNKEKWEEFREAGLLWFVNRILHLFGWAIVFHINDSGELTSVEPQKVLYRGFDPEIEDSGYIQVTNYLKDNIEQLYKDVHNE